MSAERDEVVLSVLSALLDLFFLFSFFSLSFLFFFFFSFYSLFLFVSVLVFWRSLSGSGSGCVAQTGVVMRAETFGGSGFL